MAERPESGWVRPPALLLALAAVIAVIGIGMSVVGSQRTGISTDEPGHVRRLNAYLHTGLYVRDFEVEQTPFGEIPVGAYIYGPMTSILQHEANHLVGNEPQYSATNSPTRYAISHAVIVVMALVGLLAAAAITWAIIGDWRWGVVTAGILAATPLWTGHAMFNPKDVPVASAHTLITAALVLVALAKPTTRLWLVLLGSLPLTAGTVLLLGTRPEMWPSLFASLVVFGIVLFRSHADQTRWNVARVALTVIGSLVAAHAVLRAIYPRVYSDLVEVLMVSISTGKAYDGLGDQAPNGRGYLPAHLLTDLPLGLLVLMGLGTAFALRVAFQRRRSTQIDCLALVGSQAFALMIAAVIFDAVMYQGLRQMLFAMPALAILATVGLAAAFTKVQATAWRRGLATFAGVALILPTAAQAAMFPYQYSYVNAAAEWSGAVGHDGPDYFATSFRAYAHQDPQDVRIVCPFLRFGGTVTRKSPDCRKRFAHTFSTYWNGRPIEDRPKGEEFYALLRGNRPTPPNCVPYREVERRPHFRAVVMSRMFRCHPATLAEISAGEDMKVRERAVQGWEMTADGRHWAPAD